MNNKKKPWSSCYTAKIFVVALVCALLAACETQALQTPTATPIPPTATGTPEPTSTSTPVNTATNTPTPEAPQAIIAFVENLPGEFSLVWEPNDQTWDLNHHLTVQLTETESQTTDQTVARFNADGTQMTINVKGQDVQLPVSNFGQSADQSGVEAESYQLIPGADVKTGIGFNLGIKDTVDGRVAYGYNVWGKWVENKPYQVGRLEVNDFNMFAGALVINPNRADDIWRRIIGGVFNLQKLTGNRQVLDVYPDQAAFIRAAEDGVEFEGLYVPKSLPESTPGNVYDQGATIELVEKMNLSTVEIGFMEQSADRILHPLLWKNLYQPFFSLTANPVTGPVTDVKVGLSETNGVTSLSLTFARYRLLRPVGCYGTMQIESPLGAITGSANQLLEQWFYSTGPDLINAGRRAYNPDIPGIGFPALSLCVPLTDLYSESPDHACPWAESDLVLPNQ